MINHPSTVGVGLGCPTAAPAKPLGGTLGGTYNLLLLGATVGVLGAAAYRASLPGCWARPGSVV